MKTASELLGRGVLMQMPTDIIIDSWNVLSWEEPIRIIESNSSKDIHQELKKAILTGMGDFKLKSRVSQRLRVHHEPNEKLRHQCV